MKTAKTLFIAVLFGWAAASVAATKATDKPELRAYVNESCVVADEPWLAPAVAPSSADTVTRAGPLAALVVGKLAEVLVSHSIKATAGRVSTGAERKDTRYVFARETNLYRTDFTPQPQVTLNAKLGCITLVAATFASETSCHAQYQPRELDPSTRGRPEGQWRSTRTDDSLANVLRRSDICVAGAPRSVYEARFEFSPDGTAWRLVDAGYQIETLLSTSSKGAGRNVFYTLEVLQPSGTAARGDSLTTGIVTLGSVKAGSKGEEAIKPGAWLRVPPLNAEARRNYELHTGLLQESAAEIGALERAIARNERVIAEVRLRRAATKGDLAKGLAAEETRLSVQRVTLEAELKARREEYAALPRTPREFMPVAIEVGLTETKSEQPALLAVAEVMKQSSGFIGSTAGQFASVARSVDVSADDGVGLMEAFRNAFHDARVARRIAETPDETAAAETALTSARESYAAVRVSLGLPGEVGR